MHESLLSAALPTAPQPLPRVYINLAAIFATVNYVRTCAWQKSFTVLDPGKITSTQIATECLDLFQWEKSSCL